MMHILSCFQQASHFIRATARTLRRHAQTLLTVTLLLGATTASAVPLTWTLNNVVTLDGITLTGSFVFDADLPAGPAAFSAINIVATGAGGNGPFTQSLFAVNGATLFAFNQAPAGLGQFAVGFITTAALTNAGGTQALSLGVGKSTMLTCSNVGCTSFTVPVGRYMISGTITAIAPAPVTVPTLNQWGLLILGLLMAGLAAWQVRRVGRC